MGPMHGYGIARRIEQVSDDPVLINQGTIYASLVRLQQRGWICGVGRLRQQSAGEVLRDHQGRAEAARSGDQELGADGGRDGTRAAHRGAGMTMFNVLKAMVSRLGAWMAPASADREFDQELQSHLDMLAEENVRKGM